MKKSDVVKSVFSYLNNNPWIKAKDLSAVLAHDYNITIDKESLNLILYDLKIRGEPSRFQITNGPFQIRMLT